VDVLKTNVHGTNIDSQVLELCEQVVEVVRCERKLRWLDVLCCEGEIWAGESVGEGDGGGGSGRGC
jgi:hypothetical protein